MRKASLVLLSTVLLFFADTAMGQAVDFTSANTSYITASGTTWGHLPEMAFDDAANGSSKWLHCVGSGAWIVYADGQSYVLSGYSLTSGDDVPERDPKNWRIQGSNDGTTWVTLDTKTDQNFSTRNEKQVFTISNTTSYTYHRFYLDADAGAGCFQIGEIEFLSGTVIVTNPVEESKGHGFNYFDRQWIGDTNFGAGYSFYASAWPIMKDYPGSNNYQTGLSSSWMFAQKTGREPSGWFYSDIEGGLGWWGDTRFATETPKFIMGGVALNFIQFANGPGAGSSGLVDEQRDWSDPGGKYGVAQLSPNILWPPDGLNMEQGAGGEILGYGYHPLPLTDVIDQTYGTDITTGNQCWTLFFNSGNFKGPVAFFIPTFWTEKLLDDPSLEGLFLDSRPSDQNVPFAIEYASAPALIGHDDSGRNYAKVLPLRYPATADNRSDILRDINVYSRDAKWNEVESWFNGGPVPPTEFQTVGMYNVDFTVNYDMDDHLKNFSGSIDGEVNNGSYTQKIATAASKIGSVVWDTTVVKKEDGYFVMPEYYQMNLGKWDWIDESEVPVSTGLINSEPVTRPRSDSKPYLTPMEPDCHLQDPSSPWNSPGPSAGPFTVLLGDGSELTYYWYKFIDQPSVIYANLPETVRQNLQARVELIHANWHHTDNYLPDPTGGTMVNIDPKLIVTPPAGMEVGYVAIVTRQELATRVEASFEASKTVVDAGELVTFTNLSCGMLDTYTWDFGAGADPATATGIGPHEVKYTTTGTKTVQLTVNGAFSDTETKTNYITIEDGCPAGSTLDNCGRCVGGSTGLTACEDILRIFILAGQSNMEGQGEIDQRDQARNTRTLTWVMENDDGTFAHLKTGDDWTVREDVQIYYERGQIGSLVTQKGGLTTGYGAADYLIGPELQFGHVLGDHYEDPVLIIKTAWGGKSLIDDFTPPSLGGPGVHYQEILDVYNDVIANLDTYFPEYAGYHKDLTGFCWHQGWNDGDRDGALYQDHMEAFIKDIRSDLGNVTLPFAIASSGFGGETLYAGDLWMQWMQTNIHPAQMAMVNTALYPEFEGNVTAHNTKPYWYDILESPSDNQIYHWNRNALSYLWIGNGLGEDMISMLDSDPIDCHGDVNGSAYLDDCNTCVGGNTGVTACVTQCNTTIQAEGAVYGGGATVENVHAGYNGTGFVNLPPTGGFVEFTLNGCAAGEYTLEYRHALGGGSRTGVLIVNGVSQPLTMTGTGDWANYQIESLTINLNAGTNIVRFETTGLDFGNLDQIKITQVITSLEKIYRADGLQIYPNPNAGVFTVDLMNFSGTEISVFDMSGKKVSVQDLNEGDASALIDISDYPAGVYYVQVKTEKMIYMKDIVVSGN